MKNKFFKKTPAIIASLMLTLGIFSFGASALPPDDATPRKLFVHKYLVDENFDLNSLASGAALTEEELLILANSGAAPLSGIDFVVVRAYTAEEAVALSIDITGFESIGDYFFDAADRRNKQTTVGGTAEFTFASNGSEDGVYCVIEQESTKVKTPAPPFLVSIPMADPQNPLDWLYSVHVYPKNSPNELGIVKTFSDGSIIKSYNYSEPIEWIIETAVPVAIDSMLQYKIVDVLTGQFDLIYVTSPAVDYGSGVAVMAGLTRLTEGEHYDVDYTSGVLTIDFTNYLAGLVTFENDPLTVSFSVKLVSSVTGHAGSFKNGAHIIYQKPGQLESVTLNTSSVIDPVAHFCSITINKHTSGNAANGLSGAIFKIATDAAATTFLKNPANPAEDWEVETLAGGGAVFGGLDYNLNGVKEYYLVEITPPAGYNRLRAAVRVAIDDTDYGFTDGGGNVTVDIANGQGFELPITGGRGIVLLSVIGLALMGGAVILLLGSRKRRKNNR